MCHCERVRNCIDYDKSMKLVGGKNIKNRFGLPKSKKILDGH